jgi:hypothetical protein
VCQEKIYLLHVKMALGPPVPTTAFVVVYNPAQVFKKNDHF